MLPPCSTTDYFSPKEMMKQAERYAESKANKPTVTVLALAMMAGAFIGLAFVFYITVTTGSDSGWGLTRLLGGLSFSLGLILVVLCGAELFTSSTLSAIAWANGQLSLKGMLLGWGKVYLGNFVGAMLLLLVVTGASLYGLDDGQWGLNALRIAQHKLHHTAIEAFSLGVLCNLLVCLAIWLTFSAKSAMSKAVMTVLPVAMFVSTGFEHCVANMFMVPLGIVIHANAADSFWLDIGVQASQFNDLTLSHFILANLLPVTLGNIVGGAVLVGLANWAIYRRPNFSSIQPQTITQTLSLHSVKEPTMNANVTIETIMETHPLVLSPELSIASAIDQLLHHHVTAAPVCNKAEELVGMFSVHDVMVNLWCQGYQPQADQAVADLMSLNVMSLDSAERLVDVTEFFCIDKEQLYPTTAMGIATQLSALSVEERARTIKVHKPQLLPVLKEGKLVGLVSRLHVLEALRPIYGPLSVDSLNSHGLESQRLA